MWLLLWLGIQFCRAYNSEVAQTCVDLCQASYCVTDSWNCLTCNPSAKLEYVVNKDDSKAIQGYDSSTHSLFTAFRGSANTHNWIENIQAWRIAPYNDSSVTVDKGFYKAYQYIKDPVFANLATMASKYNTRRVLITGHSLGAAMATLMAYDILISKQYDIQYLVTFGSPRVGNDNFAKIMKSFSINSYRVTHYYDIVPHVPEEMLGYLHISNEIWYDETNNAYKVCSDSLEEDATCSNSCAPVHCTSTSDHLYYLNVSMGSSDPSYC